MVREVAAFSACRKYNLDKYVLHVKEIYKNNINFFYKSAFQISYSQIFNYNYNIFITF